ncbi:immunity protein Imm33 domain-containing protein [Komagataeibacter melomenusus]
MCGVVATDGYLDFHEPVPGCPTFGLEEQPGVDACVTYREEQHAICRNIQAAFSLPEPGQLIMVSDGVYEGDLVQGVRSHMSGWWITTNRYDDDITSLRTVHACHVTAARPDLARYLAVPFGWRFDTAQGRIYVDPEAGIAENGSQGPACSKPWQRDMGREKACQYDQCYKKHHHAPNNKDMSFFCRGG